MTEAEFQSFIPTRRPQRSRGYPHRCVAISSCCSRSQAKIHQISPEATEILSVLSFFLKAQQTWIGAEMDSSSPGTLTL